jgi:hypothetical protein
MAATLPFDEFISGAQVRFTWIEILQYLSITDSIQISYNTDRDYACKVWRNVKADPEKWNELKDFIKQHQFPGERQSVQDVITFPGMLRLIMLLGGPNAAKCRSKMCKILVRYFAGDRTLLGEIEANAESDDPVAGMARASLAGEKGDAEIQSRKRKMEDLEYQERLVALENQKSIIKERDVLVAAKAHEMALKSQDAGLNNVNKFRDTLELFQPSWERDDRLRLQVADFIKNILFGASHFKQPGAPPPPQQPSAGGAGGMGTGSPPAAGDGGSSSGGDGGSSTAGSDDDPMLKRGITVSSIAAEMGHRFKNSELSQVGKMVVQKFTGRYGIAPPKHDQFCDGAVRSVNSYTERDRDIVEEAIREFVNRSGKSASPKRKKGTPMSE